MYKLSNLLHSMNAIAATEKKALNCPSKQFLGHYMIGKTLLYAPESIAAFLGVVTAFSSTTPACALPPSQTAAGLRAD